MALKLYSFSYKHGRVPKDADLVYDCRFLDNPWGDQNLRPLTGKDPLVKEFIWKDPRLGEFINRIRVEYSNVKCIAFGCHGGKHRSVAVAEIIADYARDEGIPVTVEHLELR